MEDTSNQNQLFSNTQESQANPSTKIEHILKYSAAALSLISFITTSNGLKAILETKSEWQAYLISFGIQAVVLGIGMKLAEIISAIKTNHKKTSKTFTRFLVICICLLYGWATLFSSFFSYIFLANNAYDMLKESDYNIQIDEFLINETKKLRDINTAIGQVLQEEIEVHSVQLQPLIQKINEKIKNNKNSIIKFKEEDNQGVIPDYLLFKASDIGVTVSPNLQSRLLQAEHTLRLFSASFSNLYSKYVVYREKANDSLPEDQWQGRIQELEVLDKEISDLIDNISKFKPNANDIDDRIKNSQTAIIEYCQRLSTSVLFLKQIYTNLQDDPSVSTKAIDLSSFYKVVFSLESLSSDDIDQAHRALQSIISQYIDSIETVPEAQQESIKDLSACISFLGEFKKYKQLDDNIKSFQDENLNKVYVITYPTTESHDASSSPNNSETIEDQHISSKSPSSTLKASKTINKEKVDDTKPLAIPVEEWIQCRKTDMMQFIGLVKELPDVELIFSQENNSNTVLSLLKYKDYAQQTINKSYSLNRKNLERISEIERGQNYLLSEHSYMAFFCLLISLFMDLSALFIGLYFFHTSKEKGVYIPIEVKQTDS